MAYSFPVQWPVPPAKGMLFSKSRAREVSRAEPGERGVGHRGPALLLEKREKKRRVTQALDSKKKVQLRANFILPRTDALCRIRQAPHEFVKLRTRKKHVGEKHFSDNHTMPPEQVARPPMRPLETGRRRPRRGPPPVLLVPETVRLGTREVRVYIIVQTSMLDHIDLLL